MKKSSDGNLVFLDGEQFYKIENFDMMDDFFMTITSSSDIWNFCWAHGGISAGRKNCDHAIFPYYTCDKIQDTKNATGPITIIKIKSEGKRGIVWQPFENLFSTGISRFNETLGITRNLYKNFNGSKIWFEETNLIAGLSFRYGWTSSKKYGLVRLCRIENLNDKKLNVQILDGCRNIMPPSCTADLQNNKSVLLDAYKKGEVDNSSNTALFTLSSIATDKAEPSESLKTNVSWFTTKDPLIVSDNAIELFLTGKIDFLLAQKRELNGKRGQCFIMHETELTGKSVECWEQVLDCDYDASKLELLKSEITNREEAWKLLAKDIEETEKALEEKIVEADGIESSGNRIADLHHRTNVMFNIMRGGIFADGGKIRTDDFINFTKTRNKKIGAEIERSLSESKIEKGSLLTRNELESLICKNENPEYKRLFLEYLPLTFSRRHGDPSRPWNRFNIDLVSKDGSDKINYEGNWRDIFQNWEALLWSYPEYAPNVVSVFVNAMTVEGYNPYRISRTALDWEVPEEGNPWAQFGFWGDHQVIYLQKLLEFLWKYDRQKLLSLLDEKIFSTANIPYRIKSYAEILKDPRNSIRFDYAIDKKIREEEKLFGTDARCIRSNIQTGENLQLTTLITKLVQLVLAKVLNHIPTAGIWMNTQRPEWNDANNALAGWGTSVVTMCYLYRMLTFLTRILDGKSYRFQISKTVLKTFLKAGEVYRKYNEKYSNYLNEKKRKEFLDSIESLFENERKQLYENGFGEDYEIVAASRLVQVFRIFEKSINYTIKANKRKDGLFNSYNSVKITDEGIETISLKLMLEGQVAILSCNVLTKPEKLTLSEKIQTSDMFEQNQHSYMLYPNSSLPYFTEKNCLKDEDLLGLESFVKRTGESFLIKDIKGVWHFNSDFRNSECIKERITTLSETEKPNSQEEELLFSLYEKTFNHMCFTGRSGTFYAYEGLGCIYWHMVSKLLLAAQENLLNAKDPLIPFYKDIKRGLGVYKTPIEYGAFPFDPYSHTPFKQGAKQPGMTGQVKEEIIARYMELGLDIDDGKAVFNPSYIEKKEFDEDGRITFTWCGTKIIYDLNQKEMMKVKMKNGEIKIFDSTTLPKEESRLLFERSGEIEEIAILQLRP